MKAGRRLGPLKPSEASGGRQRGEGAPRDTHRVRPCGVPGIGISSPRGCGVGGWRLAAPPRSREPLGGGRRSGPLPAAGGGRRGSLRGAGGGAAFVSPLRPGKGGAWLPRWRGQAAGAELPGPGPALPSEQWSWSGGCPRERAPRRGPVPGCAFSRPLWEPPLLRGLERPGVVPPREGSVLSVTCEAAAGAASQSGFWAAGGLRAGPWGGGMLLWVVGGYRFYDEWAAPAAINVTKQAAGETGSYCESHSQRV